MPKNYCKKPKKVAGNVKKMQFFNDFLALSGVTLEEAANMVSLTRSSIYHWMSSDNAKLSLVQDCMDGFGYKLEVFLTREDDEARGKVPVSIEDFIVIPGSVFKPKRLSFLTLALKRYDIGKTELAQKLGSNYTTIRYYFQTDDICIDKLFEIAEACGFSILFSIKKKTVVDKEEPTGKNRRYVTCRIEQETVTEF